VHVWMGDTAHISTRQGYGNRTVRGNQHHDRFWTAVSAC
jgi:hypothetical protein